MEEEAERSSGRRIEVWWNTNNRGLCFQNRWINGTGIGKFQKALPGGEQGPEQAEMTCLTNLCLLSYTVVKPCGPHLYYPL